MTTTRAVVLARGLGTRMRVHDPGVTLTPEQQRAADAGLKAMIPVNGRPFLDFLLSALADAGILDVALVVAPAHDDIERYYTQVAPPERVAIDFVVQDQPLGTANAIRSAEPWTGGAPFLAMNADNLYPLAALRTLASLDEPGLPAFDREDLVRTSNIPEERIRSFALIDIGEDGYLRGIVEKPGPPEGGQHRSASISMNCWRLDARIFDACRDVPRSARGERELPEAVGLALRRGVSFKTFPARGPVLDLSKRADTADVEKRLAGVTPRP
jgi:UDP-N-acetylglucosamine diphosphorylase / glucose-1-phosphate thymidylyltransferase / UDP-N-acetylgalactosamine diphosphorylase / glucosamine-1-phosphate N-acetyltransferase / galactosamine-1-phosphate N-acetyltransferase